MAKQRYKIAEEQLADARAIMHDQKERLIQANEDEANLKDQIETLLGRISDLKGELEGMRPLRTMKFRMDEAIRTRFNTDYAKTHEMYERYDAKYMDVDSFDDEPPTITTEYAFLRYLSRIIDYPQEFDKEVNLTREKIIHKLQGFT